MAEKFQEAHFTQSFIRTSKLLVWVIFAVCVLSLLEWMFIRINKYWLMSLLTNFLFITSTYAFALKFKKKKGVEKYNQLANRICYGILLICAIKFLLDLTGIDAHINKFWMEDLGITRPRIPTSMSANTLITFILIATAILLINENSKRKTFIAQFICVIVFFITLIATYGYILNVRPLFTLFLDVPIAQITILCFFLLSLAILLSRPQTGFMRILVGEHLTENFILRFLATIAPLILGFLKLNAEQFGLVSKTAGIAISTLLNYTLSWSIIAFNIRYQKKIRAINKRVFDHLKWNELRLSTIAENISEGVIIVKKNEETTYINSLAKDLIKNYKSNLPIKEWPKHYGFYNTKSDKLIDYSDLAITKALDGKNIDNREIKLKQDPLKESSSLLLTGRSVTNSKGEVMEAILIIRDITERKKIEKEYYKSSIKLRTILAELDDALVIIDEQGNHIFTNPKAEKLMGKFPSSSININKWTSHFGIYYPDKFTFFPSNQLPYAKALKGEKCNPITVYIKNNHIENGHYVKLTCTPVIDKDNNIYGVLISLKKTDRGRFF